MVLKGAGYNVDVYVWGGVCGHEYINGEPQGNKLLTEDDGSTDFYPITYLWDNMQVIHNTQSPDYTLRKKSDSIFYHYVCESIAMGESLTVNVRSNNDCDDLATKLLYGGKRRFHISNLLYDIYENL